MTQTKDGEKTVAQLSVEELIGGIRELAKASHFVGNRAIGARLQEHADHLADVEIGETTSGRIHINLIGGQTGSVDREMATRIRDRLTFLLREPSQPTPSAQEEKKL